MGLTLILTHGSGNEHACRNATGTADVIRRNKRRKKAHCKRPSFGLQKATFQAAICGLSDGKRRSFTNTPANQPAHKARYMPWHTAPTPAKYAI